MNIFPKSEFSRIFSADDIADATLEIDIDATPAECRALSTRFELENIKNLKAHLKFDGAFSGNKLTLRSEFSADITQICVVTLEPFDSRIEGHFHYTFLPDDLVDAETEVEFNPNEADPPEPIIDGKIDAGELVTEHLGLEIAPFPKSPKADFNPHQDHQDGDENADGPDNPFAVLAELKNR